MEITIRKTLTNEFYSTENLTREAFWNLYKPGCDEHLVLHQLRKSSSYVEELDMVAIYEHEIIGHIISTRAQVMDEQNKKHEVLCLGPVSVTPSLQGQGIGVKLMNFSITEAKKMGFRAMILFGDPGYYHRFGFVNARKYEITTKEGHNFDQFMVLELQEHGLDNIKGRFYEDEAFVTSEVDVDEFEKKFPAKEKGKARIEIPDIK
jgi:predicted N-acetyltransferase YhbS